MSFGVEFCDVFLSGFCFLSIHGDDSEFSHMDVGDDI